MSETARELATKGSGVTDEMVVIAENVLAELGVKQISKKFSNRDILYEVLRAVKILGGVVKTADDLIKSEEEWTEYFERCAVVVGDPEVGKQLLKIGTESTEAFGAIVATIAQNRGLVVPLEKYPGICLFKKRAKRKGEPSNESSPS